MFLPLPTQAKKKSEVILRGKIVEVIFLSISVLNHKFSMQLYFYTLKCMLFFENGILIFKTD